MEISYILRIDTHNLQRRFKKNVHKLKDTNWKLKPIEKNQELVRTFSQQNQHTHRDKHEEKDLQ